MKLLKLQIKRMNPLMALKSIC